MSDNVDNPIWSDIWGKIPPEAKCTAPHIATTVGSLFTSAIGYIKGYGDLLFVYKHITTNACVSAAKAEGFVEKCVELYPKLFSHKPRFLEAMTSSKTACQASVDTVKECMRPCANMILGASAALSFVGLACQAACLRSFWKEVCETKEFINSKDGKQSKFDEMKSSIQEKIDKLPGKIDAFAIGLDEKNILSMSADQRLIFHVQKSRQRLLLDKEIQGIKYEIESLKNSIITKQAGLAAIKKTTAPNLVANVSQGVSLAVNLTVFAAAASPIALFAMGAAIVGNVVAAGTMLVINHKCSGTIIELENKLKEIEQLRQGLLDIENRLTSMFLDFCDKLEEITNNEIQSI